MTLVVSPAMGDPEATHLWPAVAAGDWRTARAILAPAGRPQDDRDFLTGVAATVPGTERWLPQAVQDGGDDAVALLVYGHRLVNTAWEAAQHPQMFAERLQSAGACLQEVVRREPAGAFDTIRRNVNASTAF